MKKIGFKEAKRRVIKSIIDGSIEHEMRSNIDVKNLLYSGEVTMDEIKKLISRSRGDNYESKKHHFQDDLEIHILKAKTWYIKWYFIDPNTVFVSVHK